MKSQSLAYSETVYREYNSESTIATTTVIQKKDPQPWSFHISDEGTKYRLTRDWWILLSENRSRHDHPPDSSRKNIQLSIVFSRLSKCPPPPFVQETYQKGTLSTCQDSISAGFIWYHLCLVVGCCIEWDAV
jgi:hypothetical protein